jgi:hypothetical protein
MVCSKHRSKDYNVRKKEKTWNTRQNTHDIMLHDTSKSAWRYVGAVHT